MLRLIITLSVCVTLVHSANEGGSNLQSVAGEGKDNQEATAIEGEEDMVTSCIVCNSNLHDFCDDETFDMTEEVVKVNHSKNCYDYVRSDERQAGSKPPANAKFYCTKTKITFEFGNTNEKSRIVRDCSWEPGRYGWAGCYYTANNLYSTTVCKCENKEVNGEVQQYCNSATSIASSLFLFVTAFLMLR